MNWVCGWTTRAQFSDAPLRQTATTPRCIPLAQHRRILGRGILAFAVHSRSLTLGEWKGCHMLRSASKILGYRLSAKDGDVGRCIDLLIEDQSWSVCHVVVETGAFKTGIVKTGERRQRRELLVSPQALPKAAWNFRRWLLESTREQLESASPLEVLDGDETAADEHDVSLAEIELSPISEVMPGVVPSPTLSTNSDAPEALEPPALPDPIREPALRSLKGLLGCQLEAHDGPVGHISDLIVNDDSWSCPYLVVSDSTRAQVRQVLVPIDWVNGVDAGRSTVSISFAMDRVQAEPEFHPEAPHYASSLVQSLLGTASAANSPVEALAKGIADPRRADVLAFRRTLLAPRAWRLGPPAALAHALTWGTRGLRAALARTLQGRER